MSNPESSTSTDPIGALTAGQKLAGVYVLRRMASNPGAECLIWLAHDEVLGKDVSLHFVPAGVRTDARAMNELRQEIKRNRQLIHPNILRVYDLIEEADWAAISMDWFEGESVASLLPQKEGGFFEPADVKPWVQQICTALEDVHKINLVHRNISPPNLFIDKAGKVLIANFGISRVMDDAIGRKAKPGEAVERHLVYMSPQQLDGETPARTDDIYSLGVTIYEVLAGQPPFVDSEILSQIRKATPQPMMERRAKTGKKGGTILPAWEKVIASCLAKTPAERPQSAQDLAAKLGLSGKLAPAEPPPPVPISNVLPMTMDRAGSQKKTVIIGKDAGKKDLPLPPSQKAPLSPASAPARSYEEIVAAVEADEREAARIEMEEGKTGKQNKEDLSDFYPSLYPRKSKAPMIVFAVIVAAVCLGAYLWHISNNGQQSDEQTTDTGGQPHLSTSDVAGNGGGRSATNQEDKKNTDEPQKEPATPKSEGLAEGTDSSQPPAPDSTRRVSADVTPDSHPETTDSVKDLRNQRQQMEEKAKAADLAAEQAKQLAEEKGRTAAEFKKALADWDAKNAPKLEDREPAPSGSTVPRSPAGSQNSDAKGASAAPAASAPTPNKAAPPQAPLPPEPVLPAATGSPRETGSDTSSTPVESATLEPLPLPLPHTAPTATRTEPSPDTITAEPKVGETNATEGAGLFENSLGMKFAPVGDVLFCIWATRVKDFEVFAKETGLKSTIWRSPGFKQGPDHPVVDVKWTEATAFCKWLTERERKKGIISSSQVYRLPTDLEWSKAVGLPEESGKTPEARDMGVPNVFPWGTQWPPPPNVGNYTGEETGSDVAIKGYDDGFVWTSPVGSFPPNKYGLYDMGGNVWQWCMDNWNNESKAKVLRGASWYNGSLKLSLLSSCRVNENPDSSTDNYGFRVVRANESGRSKAK